MAIANAERYSQEQGIQLVDQLGAGLDGIVFSTDRGSAVKALRYRELHERERDVYLRLFDLGVTRVLRFKVPRYLSHHDELMIVETQIVSPPYVLDFAGAHLDRPNEFPPEIIEEWEAEKCEQFGSDWPEVQDLIHEFRRLGIYLSDVKPGNVELGTESAR